MDTYEQKYKDALERAIVAHKDEDRHLKATLERVFPELVESEDERIMNVLVELVKGNERCGYFMINNITTSDMLAWLEKQGKQECHCTGVGEPKESTGVLKQLLDEEKSWSKEDELMKLSIEQVINYASWSNIVPEEKIKINTWLKQLKYRLGG